MRFWAAIVIALALGLLVIARRHHSARRAAGPPPAAAAADTNRQVYAVRGLIKEILPGRQVVRIQHDAIPGYMEAMTMPFDVKNTNELNGLEPGDLVTFNLVATPEDGWIEKVIKVGRATVPQPETVRVSRDVEPLREGDPLPDYRFTDESGRPVALSQFRGRAVVLAFFYTRCPFPDFCPRTSSFLAKTVARLQQTSDAPANWHVLSLSFDPGFDTPAVLKSYARQFQADPAHWSFLTGDIYDIDALTEQFGMIIARGEGGGWDHNLRTVVVDAQGRVQKTFVGNQWQPEELAAEVVKAARVKQATAPPNP